MTSDKILIVDDEQLVRWTLGQAIQNWGFAPVETETISTALEAFDTHRPAVTLLDINLPDGSGLEVLRKIKKRQPDAIVIIITGNALIDDSIGSLRAGAADFIVKPINLEELHAAIRNAVKARDRRREVKELSHEQVNTLNFEQIIGESPAIRETIMLAKKVAVSDVSCVLLQGESGTGKDLIAKAIHYSSSRAGKQFVAINCAAIPAALLESELFGFEKGAFTDAKALKQGLFEQAEGGTLFLDEIGELELGLQAKLLRVLEEGTFRRVGGLKDLPLSVRVIAASNRDLRVESEAKRFRLDLYYRLSVIEIDLPALRDRGDDVILLANHFIKIFDKNGHSNPPRNLSPEVVDLFRRYHWAGNVRELRNVIERALILEENDSITMKYMPRELLANTSGHLNGDALKAKSYVSLPPEGMSLDMVETSLIQQALERCGGNVTRASELLRVSRDRIRYHLKKNKIERRTASSGSKETFKRN